MRELPKGFEAKLRFVYAFATNMDIVDFKDITDGQGTPTEDNFVEAMCKYIAGKEDPKEFDYWISKFNDLYSNMKERYPNVYPLYLVAMQQMDELREMARNSNLSDDEMAKFERRLTFDKKDILEKIKENDIFFIETVILQGLERRILKGDDMIKGTGKIYETDPNRIQGVIEKRISQRIAPIKADLHIKSDVGLTRAEKGYKELIKMAIAFFGTLILIFILCWIFLF